MQKKLSLAEVTAIGIGGMIGGGIFAVLGLAIAVAGHAVAFALLAGGVIALLTGISYAHLGLEFRNDGGSFTYIEKAFTAPGIAGFAGWLLVAGYVGTLALYASAFGAYGATFLPESAAGAGVLAAVVLTGFLVINLVGAKLSGGVELGVVAIKLAILALFAVIAATGIKASHFTPVFDHGFPAALSAVALIFVAYEGFELIPNAIDEMAAPERNLKRAIVIAICLTTLIYVAVAVVALGNLTPAEIAKDQEYVLAVAARPMLGQFGFTLIAAAALLSTASAINATLFGAARLAMVMARERALPAIFSMRERNRPIPYVALILLTVLSLAFALFAPLEEISLFASATFLLIFFAVNLAAFRLSRRIAIKPVVPLAGCLLCFASFLVLVWHTFQTDPVGLLFLAGAYGVAAVLECALVLRHGRRPA
ncbi:APC family permease [Martelella sp. HB161492]|uniref:amino acid permease n=1 Tax=Martelella sp. HB161492 TaxID=2720726 RepID=UPI001592757B